MSLKHKIIWISFVCFVFTYSIPRERKTNEYTRCYRDKKVSRKQISAEQAWLDMFDCPFMNGWFARYLGLPFSKIKDKAVQLVPSAKLER